MTYISQNNTIQSTQINLSLAECDILLLGATKTFIGEFSLRVDDVELQDAVRSRGSWDRH